MVQLLLNLDEMIKLIARNYFYFDVNKDGY